MVARTNTNAKPNSYPLSNQYDFLKNNSGDKKSCLSKSSPTPSDRYRDCFENSKGLDSKKVLLNPPTTQQPSFGDQVRGKAPQKEMDLNLMLMSDDCYHENGKGDTHTDELSKAGWKRLKQDKNGQILDCHGQPTGINAADIEDSSSGFRAAIYQNDQGHTVVAYAGTDTSSAPDVATDIGQGIGADTAQYREAEALAQKAQKAFGPDVALTGHSLGGGLASAASLATNSPAVTFNAAGLSDETIRSLGQSPYEARQRAEDGQLRTYQIRGDLLTGLQNDVPLINFLPDALGHKLNLEGLPGDIPNVKEHLQDVLIQALRTEKPVSDPSLKGDIAGLTSEASERIHEGLFDFNCKTGQELGGLLMDGVISLQDLGNDADSVIRHEFTRGKVVEGTAKLAGDTVESALNLGGDVIDRSTNVAARAVEDIGQVGADNLRLFGEYLGLSEAGQAAGNVLQKTTEFIGNGIDGVGNCAEKAVDTLGNVAETGADFLGKTGQKALDGIRTFGSWINPFD